jgi:general L-amino acid transport system substrate-binding protein
MVSETKGNKMMHKLLTIALTTALGFVATSAYAGTLADVKAKGFVQCGVAPSTPGFAIADSNNNWAGLDVDYCKALASAIFNDPAKVRFTPLTSTERFAALSAGEVDLLSRTTTWTMSRDTQLGIKFVGTTYYDGQGFMVHKAANVKSVKELDGASICIEKGTTTELNAADYFAANGLKFNPVVFEAEDETVKAYEDGRCDAFTTDSSALAGERATFPDKADNIILPEIISKEPLAVAVRQGDDEWFNLTRWTYYALLEAEEYGVTQANVDQMVGSDNPSIKRLMGVEGDFGTSLGVSKDWAYQIIKNVGNYGEIFERNVGPNSALGLARGLNALWKDGGLQYSPPIR